MAVIWPILMKTVSSTLERYEHAVSDFHGITSLYFKVIEAADLKQYWWLCSLFYPLTIASCKLSFAFFWFRIIPRRAYPVYSWIIYVAVFFSVVGGVVLFFVALFLCQPISYFWDKEQAGRCMSPDAAIFVAFVLSACNIATDFTFAILPVFVVWTLKLKRLKRRMKFATMFLILMGCV